MGSGSSKKTQPTHHTITTSNQQQPQQQQRQQPQPAAKDVEEKTDIKVKKVKLDKNILERYLELEKQTRQLESKNVLKSYTMKLDQLKEYEENLKEFDAHYKKCIKETAKEKADVDQLIKEMFSSEADYQAQHTKEEEEYLEALNTQEIAKKELENTKKFRDQIKSEVSTMKKEVDQLQKIYVEQDELLASVFSGKYGSDQEYKLESELDMLLDRKQRISVAKYKWQNGRLLLHHAVTQLTNAVKKWQEVAKISVTDMKARYTMATETRNNLVAGTQNITSAQKYLHTIQFPYCKPDELATLTKATNNIYTDMQSDDRHMHAMNCYNTTHKRAGALLQWFDHVIKTTIDKDMSKATNDVDAKTKELRRERLRLIKEKIQEAKGADENLDVEGEMDLEDGPEPELQHLVTDAEGAAKIEEQPAPADRSSSTGPTPLPLNQLAPAPNQDDLFGDINDLKQQHEKDMVDFSRTQDVNKARMEQGLQEKLKARRSRRARQTND